MRIQILSVDVKTVPTPRGSYQAADVAFKNLTFQGKIEGKKLMSFGATGETFKVLANAQSSDIFEITVVKNDKGFNDWTAAVPSTESAVSPVAAPSAPGGAASKPGAASAPVRSSYETPEERAQRQVFIIRQSNLSAAVNMLTAGAKSPPKIEEVFAVAKQFENYVLGVQPSDHSFDTMNDDMPE